MIVKATDERQMAAVMVAVLEFARSEPEEFVFGPFNRKQLMETGLVAEGDIDRLRDHIESQFPAIEISDG